MVVSGGVAANSKVRAALTRLASQYKLPFLAPPPKFCTDNGLMVAWTGLERLKQGLSRAPPPSMDKVRGVGGCWPGVRVGGAGGVVVGDCMRVESTRNNLCV